MKLPPLPKKAIIDRHIPTGVVIYGYTKEQLLKFAEEAVKLNG